jgi:hypothetical protein
MKRKQFVRQLEKDGCVFVRHGEIDNTLAKHIRKYMGLD